MMETQTWSGALCWRRKTDVACWPLSPTGGGAKNEVSHNAAFVRVRAGGDSVELLCRDDGRPPLTIMATDSPLTLLHAVSGLRCGTQLDWSPSVPPHCHTLRMRPLQCSLDSGHWPLGPLHSMTASVHCCPTDNFTT